MRPEGASKVIYAREPLRFEEGIPVFSESTVRYVDNYKRIAADHVASMAHGAENPFIESQLWKELEASTRDMVARIANPGQRVLDVGVGMGRVLGPLTQLHRFGVDISFDYLKIARECGFEVAFSLIEQLPYEDAYFDMVVACDVLEHVLDLFACSREMLRVLKPGGALVIRVPYKDDLEAYLDESLPYEFIHLRAFDVPSLRLHFEKIFDCRYIEHAFVAPYLKGAPRMKIQQLKLASPIYKLLAKVEKDNHPLAILKKATLVSEEEFINWIYALRDNHPTQYGQIVNELVHGLEVNIVFRKPG
jgi:SAM-dependent methyltransferase